jgi:5-methylcytosine-specific restriction endonuclease McrA
MEAVLHQSVLVLNRNFVPINVTTVFDAVCSVFGERAKFVDPETYAVYDFGGWLENWSDVTRVAKISFDHVIHCPRVDIVAPEVILCTDYKGVGFGMSTRCRPKFSRRNIFARDKGYCQYCGKKYDSEDLNVDHVVPRAQGGRSEWTNVVLSCIGCNDKKANRTPEQAGMRLIRKPVVPTAEEVRRPLTERLKRKIGGRPPKSWEAFLGKMVSESYWEAELKK